MRSLILPKRNRHSIIPLPSRAVQISPSPSPPKVNRHACYVSRCGCASGDLLGRMLLWSLLPSAVLLPTVLLSASLLRRAAGVSSEASVPAVWVPRR